MLIYPWTDVFLSWFHFWAVRNSAAANTGGFYRKAFGFAGVGESWPSRQLSDALRGLSFCTLMLTRGWEVLL